MLSPRTFALFLWYLFAALCTLASSSTSATQIITSDLLSESKHSIEFNEAVRLVQQGNLNDAEEKVARLLEIDPNNALARVVLADVYYGLGNTQEAGEELKKALEIDGKSAAVQTALGRWHVLQKEYAQAIPLFTKAIERDRNLADPEIELGSLYLVHLGDLGLAEDHYRRAMEIVPDRVDIRYAFASVMAKQGDIDTALRSLDLAIKVDADDPYPWQFRAAILSSSGRVSEALESLKQALKRAPLSPEVHWAMGELHIKSGNTADALNSFNQVIKIDPNNAGAYTRLGLVHQLDGDFASAEINYKTAVSIDPNLALAYNNLAYGASKSDNRQEEALLWATKAVELQPYNPEFIETLSMVYENSGNVEVAEQILTKLLEDFPEFEPARTRLERLRP